MYEATALPMSWSRKDRDEIWIINLQELLGVDLQCTRVKAGKRGADHKAKKGVNSRIGSFEIVLENKWAMADSTEGAMNCKTAVRAQLVGT